jgi:DnaK suppressor protein
MPGVDAEADNDDEFDHDSSSSNSGPSVVRYERNGHYMDADQLTHFSHKLAEWKQQLMEEVDRTVGHMKDDATNFPDPNDRATQEEEFSLELRTRDRERKLIKKINEAQKRIDDDEYGYCETCGIEIGVSRLEARPTAELCIDCKTLEEIRERQTA